MKTIALVIALAACSKTNDVTLLLGPDEDRLSRGFVCRADASPNPFLMAAALVPGTGKLRFALVVDVLELDAGGVFPGCRGEELRDLCRTRNCKKTSRRTCVDNVEVDFPAGFNPDDPADVKALVTEFRKSIGERTLISDVTSAPVIIRVVAMKECPASDDLDVNLALGCAYSCPVQLDQISGSVSISIDTIDNRCESTVRACAGFPSNL
ncbi:MAG: hypothetical protein M4D80_10555 [Myxococcota bacterium]|nr:hypothetical protein [Myxococcota bacterium]